MVLRRVVLPQLVPAIRASLALGFALSLGELGATLTVYPPGFATVPIVVVGQVGAWLLLAGVGAVADLAARFACRAARHCRARAASPDRLSPHSRFPCLRCASGSRDAVAQTSFLMWRNLSK